MNSTDMMAEAVRLVEHAELNQLVQAKGITDRLSQDILVATNKAAKNDPSAVEKQPYWPLYVLLVRIRNAIMAGDKDSTVALAKTLSKEIQK